MEMRHPVLIEGPIYMEESLEQIQQLHIQWCNPIRPQLTTHHQCCECKTLEGYHRHVHNLICGQVDVSAKCAIMHVHIDHHYETYAFIKNR